MGNRWGVISQETTAARMRRAGTGQCIRTRGVAMAEISFADSRGRSERICRQVSRFTTLDLQHLLSVNRIARLNAAITTNNRTHTLTRQHVADAKT